MVNTGLIKFNNEYIFISIGSFQQNKLIAKSLRQYVKSYIYDKNIVCIGGESYMYGLTNMNVNYISHYTNSNIIYSDCNRNNLIYKKELTNKIIDYNSYNRFNNGDILIINIAHLNINLLTHINKRFYKNIIIINCHHEEFWNRIKYLSKYKLIIRKQFITNINFITVNIFKYIDEIPIYISLGTTCAVAYNLNKVGLRKESYPFDWCKMNVNKLNKVLENDFKDFNEISIKRISFKHLDINNNPTYLAINKYCIQFAHELLKIEDNDNFKNKLQRRIDRFKELKNKKVIFIILNGKKDKINKELLTKYVTNYKIIEINSHNIDWTLSNLNWHNILF
jgi:hypothetical protein